MYYTNRERPRQDNGTVIVFIHKLAETGERKKKNNLPNRYYNIIHIYIESGTTTDYFNIVTCDIILKPLYRVTLMRSHRRRRRIVYT